MNIFLYHFPFIDSILYNIVNVPYFRLSNFEKRSIELRFNVNRLRLNGDGSEALIVQERRRA